MRTASTSGPGRHTPPSERSRPRCWWRSSRRKPSLPWSGREVTPTGERGAGAERGRTSRNTPSGRFISMDDLQTHWSIYESPIGPLTLIGSPKGLTDLRFPGKVRLPPEGAKRPLPAVEEQLDAYFAGELRDF